MSPLRVGDDFVPWWVRQWSQIGDDVTVGVGDPQELPTTTVDDEEVAVGVPVDADGEAVEMCVGGGVGAIGLDAADVAVDPVAVPESTVAPPR